MNEMSRVGFFFHSHLKMERVLTDYADDVVPSSSNFKLGGVIAEMSQNHRQLKHLVYF